MVKRLGALLLLAALLFSLTPPAAAVQVSARAAVVLEPTTGTFLYEKQADDRLPMASTTKIMTAVVALEQGELSDVVTVSRRAALTEGSSMYLQEGEQLTLEELLYGLLLRSGNDAAMAIAEHIGGSVEDFVALMNEKAGELGLVSTSFENPSGLDGENHYTTARELAKLAAYALSNPDFARMVSTKSSTASGGRVLKNHNKLLWLYDGATGIKTGYTKRTGRCLVSSAQRDGITLIAVTLNAPDDWRDHTNMLNEGFSKSSLHQAEEPRTLSFDLPVAGGDPASVMAVNTESGAFISFGDEEVTRVVELPRFVYPPVEAGQQVGCVNYYVGEELRLSIPLCAVYDSGLPEPTGFWERLWLWFTGLFN